MTKTQIFIHKKYGSTVMTFTFPLDSSIISYYFFFQPDLHKHSCRYVTPGCVLPHTRPHFYRQIKKAQVIGFRERGSVQI